MSELRPSPSPRALECMEPLPGTIAAPSSAAAARRRLERERLPFLVVVAAGTGRFVGAVNGESLAPAECCGAGRRRCTVVQHLAPHVHFCFQDEQAEEVAEAEADLAARGKVPAVRRIPLIVVDQRLRPAGCFTGATVRRRKPDAAPRAA